MESILENKIQLLKEKGYSVVNISADNTKVILLKSIQSGRFTSYINAKLILKNNHEVECKLYSNYIDDAIILKTKLFIIKFGNFDLQESKLKLNMTKLGLL